MYVWWERLPQLGSRAAESSPHPAVLRQVRTVRRIEERDLKEPDGCCYGVDLMDRDGLKCEQKDYMLDYIHPVLCLIHYIMFYYYE